MVKRVVRKTPGKVPGMNFVDELSSMEVETHPSSIKTHLMEEIAKEIQSEREEDLITISARLPRSLAKKIRAEAFSNELNVGTYLRKFLAHAFT